MSKWDYELVPVGKPAAQKQHRSVYQAMLAEFVDSPFSAVEVRYGDRGTQAIYMGLRAAKKAGSPEFDDVRIRREGSSESDGKVLLEK